MKKYLTIAALVSLFVTSCDDGKDVPAPNPGNQDQQVVKTSFAAYSGSGQPLEGENTVNDLHACIFEDGRMTAVFENIPSSGSSYEIKIGDYTGNLYVFANTGGQLDLDSLLGSDISEDEWLRQTVVMERGGPAHFFSGSVNLDSFDQTVIPVTLKRGVARFDLRLRTAGDASVSGITFRNLAQSAFLFPVDGELSPAEVSRDVAAVTFDDPLISDTPAVIYVYEQANEGIEVEVQAVIDGKPATLTKVLSGDLQRNTIYTLTVRKDDIDVTLDVTFEDWEEGDDTELTPVVRHL